MTRRKIKLSRENIKNNWPTFKRLIRLMFKFHPILIIIVIINIIINAISNVAGALFLKNLFNNYIIPLLHMKHPNFWYLEKAILIIGFIYVIGVLSTLFYTQLMASLAQDIQLKLRKNMFTHMQTLPISYFDQNKFGDIMSHYTNDIDSLLQMMMQSLPQFVSALFNIIFVLIGMIYLSIALTFISISTFFIGIIFLKFLNSKTSYFFGLQQKDIGLLDSIIEESLNGQKIIKLFSHESYIENKFDQLNDQWALSSAKANGYATMLYPFMGNLGNILYVLIAVFGGFFSVKNMINLSLGSLAAFLQLSRSFSGPLVQISQQLNNIMLALAGGKRIFNLLDEKSESNDGIIKLVHVSNYNNELVEVNDDTGLWAWKNQNDYILLKGNIRFKNVSFGYIKDKPVLKNINLDIKSGQKVAFVGPTGAGKTTIINILNRFYEIEKGIITFDGIDIRNINKKDLRKSLGIVLQQTYLFSGTIMENIRYGNLKSTDYEILKAAKLANADSFIEKLPNKYQTFIKGDDTGLSQGQCQLLSIARAAVSNSPIMILDEATSNIDTKTERKVQQAMDKLMYTRTSLVIAHRLSTIFNSDLIVVIEDGKIVEKGNHEELINKRGKYYQLYTGNLSYK